MTTRTRFAPSPTGLLHIGSVRTALFNYLYAKHNGGKFILRIEDTDKARSRIELEDAILEDLEWLGINPDEGPSKDGRFSPYRQSERNSIYLDHAGKLLGSGKAYHCYCTKDRLKELTNEQKRAGKPPRYDGKCKSVKNLDLPHVLRLDVNLCGLSEITFEDKVKGKITFLSKDIGDFILLDTDSLPSYNFAAAIDDPLMGITDVIRGEDHISNTPRQIMIQRALGLKVPDYAHLPLVLGEDKKILSKRDDSFSIKSLRDEGYLPSAIINATARLGWAPGDEYISIMKLIDIFSLSRISSSPSSFNRDTLKRYNKDAISGADNAYLAALIKNDFPDTDAEKLELAIAAVKSNCGLIESIKILVSNLIGGNVRTEEAKTVLEDADSRMVNREFMKAIEASTSLGSDNWKEIAKDVSVKSGKKGRSLYGPIRAALTGSTSGIELLEVINFLGRDEVLKRIKEHLGENSGA